MSETRPQPYSEAASCPAKIFLLGEYAVLDQRPCVVTTLRPRFRLSRASLDGPATDGPATIFHPQSPSGELLSILSSGTTQGPAVFHFEDRSGGGLGASTAQFALLWSLLREKDWHGCWGAYREITAHHALPPSGADLIAQWNGGICRIQVTGNDTAELERIADSSFDGSAILIFSAAGVPGRKVPTHEHLRNLASSGFPRTSQDLLSELEELTSLGSRALGSWHFDKSHAEFAESLNGFAAALHAAGLEAEATTDDRRWFSRQNGVLGAKGSGALQADAVIALLDAEFAQDSRRRGELISGAEARGLRLVANGLAPEHGLEVSS